MSEKNEKIVTQGACQNCQEKVSLAKAKQHIGSCFAQSGASCYFLLIFVS